MKVTCFEHLTVVQGYVEDIDTVAELVSAPVELTQKSAARLFSPCEFVGNHRSNEHARAMHFGVLEFDKVAENARDTLIAYLTSEGYDFAFYTTFSHDPTAGSYCFRIAVPFTQPVPAKDWSTSWWPKLVSVVCPPHLGISPDPQCKDAARFYYEPSFDPSRKQYHEAFHVPGRDVDLGAPLPPSVAPQPSAAAQPGERRSYNADDLHMLEKRLRRRQSVCAQSAAECAKFVRKGDAWGDISTRNERLSNLCYEIIAEWPDCDFDAVAQMFAASCQIMQQQGGEAIKYTVGFVAGKLREKVRYVLARTEQYARENHDEYLAELNKHGFSGPYTPDQIVDLHRMEVHPHGWILQVDNGAYVRTVKSGYTFFRGVGAAKNAAHLNLMPARPYGVTTMRYDKDKVRRVLPLDELVLAYGTVPDRIRGSLVSQETRWSSETRTLTIAECPLRPIKPRFSAAIDGWLKLLGGDRYEDLLRWMAWSTHLDHACAMLVLAGPTGCGKSLFARGLSRLWTLGEPTALVDALDAFNAGLARCPLLFADEKVPRARDGRHRFDDMRELISKRFFSINEKNVPKRDVEGAVRIVVAINDLSLLVGETPESADELKATLERIVHITPSPETPAYLDALREAGAQWGDDAIAEHALFLRQAIALPKNPPRFLFDPRVQTSLANAFVGSSAMFAAICSWLIAFLRDPRKLYSEISSLHDPAWRIRVTANGVYATANAIQTHWARYEEKKPFHRAVRSAFQGLKRYRSTFTGPIGVVHTDLIDLERLFSWAEENAVAEREELLKLIDEYIEEDVYTHAEHAVRQRIAMRHDATVVAPLRKKG